MRSLRYAYILALATWLGGMTIAGLVVAPVTFGVLEAWNPSTGRVLAGDVFGAVLSRMNRVAYIAGGVMFLVLTMQRVLGPRPRAYGIRVALIVIMLALTVYTAMVTAPRIDELQSLVAGPMSELPAEDGRRQEFDRLHSLSTSLAMATIVGGLALLGWETRD